MRLVTPLTNHFLLLCLAVFQACQNPKGTSLIEPNHTPFIQSPAAFSFTQIIASNQQVTLKWRNSLRAASYSVAYGTSPGSFTTEVGHCQGRLTSCVITGLTNNSLYYFTVIAKNQAGSLAISSSGVGRPIGPFTISTASAGSENVQLTWGSALGATAYTVKYGTSPGLYPNTASTNALSPYSVTGLNNGVTYYFTVIATNAENGETSSTDEVSTAPSGIPTIPTSLSVTPTTGQNQLSWNSVPGAAEYRIYRGTISGSYALLASGITSSTFVDSSVVNGTSYFYVVRSYNGGESPNSNEASGRPIANFNMLGAAPSAAGTLAVTWNTAVGANSYLLQYGVLPGLYSGSVLSATSPTTVTGLTPGIVYYFRAVASNNVGNGAQLSASNEVAATPLPAISPPTGLAATGAPGQVSLTWTAASGASSYSVLRGTSSGALTEIASGVTGTSYTDSTVSDGTIYYYAARSFNGLQSALSSEVSVRPIANFSLSSAAAQSATSVALDWNAPAGATSFTVRYGTSTGSYPSVASTSATAPFAVTGLSPATTYYFMVTATNTTGTGTALNVSNPLSATTATASTTGLTATVRTAAIDLSWSAVTGATSYKVYRGGASGAHALIASGISATNYTDTAVANGTDYYYVVRATNGTDSAPSNEVAGKPIASFSITGLTAVSTSSVSLTWTAAAGTETYDVRYGTAPGSYSTTLTNRTSPMTVTGLTPGQTYYYMVTAKNAVGVGAAVNADAEASLSTNSAPSVSAIADQTMQADASRVVNYTISDAQQSLNCTTSVAKSSTNPSLLPSSSISLGGVAPNCTLTLTPVTGQTGTTTVQLDVSDGTDTTTRIFVLTVNPCTVASIQWETQPVGMVAGNLFATAPRVSLRQADNSLCTTNLSEVVLSISDDPSVQGDAEITATDAVIPSGGYALFNSARMTRAGAGFTVVATQGATSSVESSAFTVTAASASSVVFATQPSSTDQFATMLPSPVVRTADAYGNYRAVNAVPITLSLQNNTNGAALGGTLVRNTSSSGISTFAGLTVNKHGDDFFFRATTTSYGSVDSEPFDIESLVPQNSVTVMETLGSRIDHPGGTVAYNRASTMFGTSTHDGTINWTWEIVAKNLSTTATVMRLRRSSTSIATITVPGNTTLPTRFSTTFANTLINTTNSTYTPRAENGTATVFSSRIIAAQTNAYRTQIHIPLLAIPESQTNPFHTATSTTYSAAPGALSPTFSWSRARLGKVDNVYVYFAYTSGSSSVNACVQLFNRNTNLAIGAEKCVKSASAEQVTNYAIAPSLIPDGAQIEARMRTSSASFPAKIFSVTLIARVINIQNLQSVQLVGKGATGLSGDTDFTQYRALSRGGYGTATVENFLQCRGRATSPGSGIFVLMDHGSNVSGTSSATGIPNADAVFTNNGSWSTIEAGPFSSATNSNHFVRLNSSSGSFDLSHCFWITEATY